jgi:hypothetical protein
MRRLSEQHGESGGQALVEFVLGAGVLLAFLLLLPLIGNLLEIRFRTVEAANYSHWAMIKEIAVDEAMLTAQVRQAFYARRGRGDLPDGGVSAWMTFKGKPLVNMESVRMHGIMGGDQLFKPADKVTGSLALPGNGLVVTDVSVGLSHLSDYFPVGPASTLHEKSAGLAYDWRADGPADVEIRLDHASKIHPYPKAQRRTMTKVARLLKKPFGEPRLETNMIRPEYVPMDRLELYAE